jgi:hypothetical protein
LHWTDPDKNTEVIFDRICPVYRGVEDGRIKASKNSSILKQKKMR